jgi:hypothetical protein
MRTASATVVLSLCLAIFCASAPAQETERPLNVLFLGNSLTQVADVPGAFRDVVAASGLPAPHIGRQILWGQPLSAHVAKFKLDGPEKDIVTTAIAAGAQWDFAVLQAYRNDDPVVERWTKGKTQWPEVTVADAVKLAERVCAHSPKARVVLYERWAAVGGRKENGGHKRDLTEVELARFTKVLASYRQVNSLAIAAVNAKCGKDVARMAPVGEGFAAYGYQGLFGDGLHQNNHGALLAAMVMYMTIYEQKDLTKVDAKVFLAGAWNKKQKLTAADFTKLSAAAVKAMAVPVDKSESNSTTGQKE